MTGQFSTVIILNMLNQLLYSAVFDVVIVGFDVGGKESISALYSGENHINSSGSWLVLIL